MQRSIIRLWVSITFFTCSFLLIPGNACTLANDRSAAISGAKAVREARIIPGRTLDGSGIIIGIADSGLDRGSLTNLHPDLLSEAGRMPRIAMLRSYSGRAVPDDPLGHGTHMASTLVGSGAASGGKYQGIAPGASLYFQALLDAEGQVQVPLNSRDLFLPAYAANARIHVNGWGRESNKYTQYSADIDGFVFSHPDFLPIFGAGNLGPSLGSLSSEANSKNALVVGSSQIPRPTFSTEASSSFLVSPSSSRGPAEDGRIKPDLLAPGSAVISAASSLIKSNFTANSAYTRMGGSSMAAAVTGGNTAILAQYLRESQRLNAPSSALFKALLINGADRVSGEVYNYGFGILDLTQTILSLEHKLMRYIDQERFLREGEEAVYRFSVNDSALPVKATLTWIDPAALPNNSKALVNDLNLELTAPDGTVYYGNDFNHLGLLDERNNVEQIYLENPLTGTYELRVKGKRFSRDYPSQDFALAYGQIMKKDTVIAVDNMNVTLSGGSSLSLLPGHTTFYRQGKSTALNLLFPGAEIYYSSQNMYLFEETWEEEGIQPLTDERGTMLVEMNAEVRDGGYYIDPVWLRQQAGRITYNYQPIALEALPYGTQVNAVVNPFLQTLWGIRAKGDVVSGFVDRIDPAAQSLRLLNDQRVYQLSSSAALSYTSARMEGNAESLPFGYFEEPSLHTLMPGMKVSMMINPDTGEIFHIGAERETVLAKVVQTDLEEQRILLDNHKWYAMFSGSALHKQGQTISLEQLQPGEWLAGILLPESDRILSAGVIEALSWGKVIYYGERNNQLYLLDQNNNFQLLPLDPQVKILKNGAVLDRGSLRAGQWIRTFYDPQTLIVYRIDIGTTAEEKTMTLQQYDPETGQLLFADGSSMELAPASVLVRQGVVIQAEDILSGDQIQLTCLAIPGSSRRYLAKAEILKVNPAMPNLTVQAYAWNGALIIKGWTDAAQVSVYRDDGRREVITVNPDGDFGQVFSLLEGESSVTAMALSPGMSAQVIQALIVAYPSSLTQDSFSDTIFSPYQKEIEYLRSRGIVNGYEDKTFRPEQPVSRLEFMSMLVNATGSRTDSLEELYYFKDFAQIPWWGLTVANTVKRNGWVEGFPDQTFRPQELLTAAELKVIMSNIEGFDLVLPLIKGTYATREEAARVVYLLMVSGAGRLNDIEV